MYGLAYFMKFLLLLKTIFIMANLKNFLNSNIQPGRKFDLYLGRIPHIGNMTPEVVESIHLKAKGEVTILGTKYSGTVEIKMDNEHSPKGKCEVVFNGASSPATYKVEGSSLIIYPEQGLSALTLQKGDRSWSWFGVTWGVTIWIGSWPATKVLSEEDIAAVPKEFVTTT